MEFRIKRIENIEKTNGIYFKKSNIYLSNISAGEEKENRSKVNFKR